MAKEYYRTGLLFVTIFVLFLMTSQSVFSQEWLDNSWPYRIQVVVSNPSATELTDYQVRVNLNGGNFNYADALSDGSDIRVAADDGITALPFWIESWDATGQQALIWIKVPLLPVSGTAVYIYYGNPESVNPDPELVETPPSGPFTKDPDNPGVINGTGAPTETASILPENIVYDPVTQHYWMALSDQSSGTHVGLAYSDDPSDPDAWYWGGYPIEGNPSAIAPHLIEHSGTWYLFYGDRAHGTPYPIAVASSADVDGPYTYIGSVLLAGDAGTWEDYRVDEPYVFQRADGKWILIYMGDAGSTVEQVGYATADNLLGPYTKFTGNPCIPFGPSGTYDAGTVADPWVYEFDGVYYIGYTVSPTSSSPWQTALATTTDWLTFDKHGVILDRGAEYNSFRGAVTRIGDEYVFPYTGGPAVGQYRLCIATQPVFQAPVSDINEPEAVFDFYDGFDGTSVDLSKWTLVSGSTAQTVVADGSVSLNATATYVLMRSTMQFGVNYVSETRARHPSAGTFRLISEVGFSDGVWNAVRIADYYIDDSYWQRQAKLEGGEDAWINMAQTADQDWHIFRLYREGSLTAGFGIDENPVETTTANVPTMDLPVFLMSYGNTNQYVIDWTRVRKWAGADPVAVVGGEEHHTTAWTGLISNDWSLSGNWTAGVPGSGSIISIPGGTTTSLVGGSLTLDPAGSLTLDPGGEATITGDLTNNGSLTIGSTITSSGSLIVNGTSSGDITYNRQLKPGSDAAADWHLAAPPVATNSAVNTGKVNAVYEWSEPAGAWAATSITSALPGHGYNIQQEDASDGVISFIGPLVNSDVTIDVSSPYADAIDPDDNYFDRTYATGRSLSNMGGGGWNLLGNPYTSAISAEEFINANYNATPALSQFDPNYVALYLFDGTNRRYYYIANSTGWPAGGELSATHVQAGQGFFVLAMNDNSEFLFTRAMQEHGTLTAMLKSSSTGDRWPGLQLKVKHGTGEAYTTVVYDSQMTTDVDPGYDIGLFKSGQDVEIYTTLAAEDNGINYTRQALPLSVAETITVPVGIDFGDGGEVIFSAVTVPAGNNKFWLEDRTAGTFTDLTTGTYTVTLPAESYGPGRFYILASATAPTGVILPEEETDLRIWSSLGKIIIKGQVSVNALCEIFDLSGQKMLGRMLTDGDLNTIDLPDSHHGVVVVRISEGDKVTSKKVVVP